MHDGLAHVGVGVAGQRPEPGLHRVQGLAYGDEPAPVDDALDGQQLLAGLPGIAIGNDDGGGQVAEGHVVGAQLLQRLVGIGGLVVGIGVDQRRLAVEHHLAQDGGDRLALGEPLPAEPGEVPGRLGLVEGDPARGPAIGEPQVVEGIEQARRRYVGEAEDGQHAQVLIAELGLDAAQEGRIADDGVEMGGDVRHRNRVAPVADDTVQVGQRLRVAQNLRLRQDGGQHLEGAVGLDDEPFELRVRLDLDGGLVRALVEQALGPSLVLRRRQVEER